MKHKQAKLKARALYYGKHRNMAIAASRAWNAKNAKSSLRRTRKHYAKHRSQYCAGMGQSSLVPRPSSSQKRRPGIHCLRMRQTVPDISVHRLFTVIYASKLYAIKATANKRQEVMSLILGCLTLCLASSLVI